MSNGRRAVLMVVVAALCVAAGVAIGVLVLGEFGETEGRILMTSAALAAAGLLALPAAILLDQGRARPLAGALIAATGLGFALFTTTIWWTANDPPAPLLRTLATVLVTAVALAQTAALWIRRDDGDPRAVRWCFAGSSALAALVAALVVVAVWGEVEDGRFYRLLGVLVVLDLLLVALQPTLARMHATRRAAHRLRLVLDSDEEVDMTVRGRDFAGAVATAVHRAERDRGRVVRVERLDETG